MRKLRFVALIGALSAVQAFGSLVTETAAGAGNTVATAQAIAGSAFTLPIPGTVFAGLGPTATVQGGLQTSNDVDFYSFFLLTSANVNIDIDNNPFTFDTVLSLFNSSGTLIAYDDDTSSGDAGSESGLDSFLGTLTLAPGTYYIAISKFANFPTASSGASLSSLVRPDGLFGGNAVANATAGNSSFGSSVSETAAGGAAYNLYVSVGDATVPEPSTLSMLGLAGIVALGARKRLSRRA